jgi:hypothetical protein
MNPLPFNLFLYLVVLPWLVALATCAIQTAWFKKDGPFEVGRAYAEARGGWFGRMLGCTICSAYYVAFCLTIIFVVPIIVWPALCPWLYLPLIWLATTTIAHQVGIVPRENHETT